MQLYWGGQQKALEIQRAEDLFTALEQRHAVLPQDPRVIRASSLVKFTDAKKERTVTISSSKRAYYKHDDDGEILEAWMRRRGFISFGKESTHAAAEIVELH